MPETGTSARHLTYAEVEAGLDHIRAAPADAGVVELIVRRPAVGERELVDEAELHPQHGLVGDNWLARGRSSGRKPANPLAQVTLASVRAIELVAGSRDRWPLAGDQLYVDLDLSRKNLPPGTRLAVGTAVLEVTTEPHTGCKKFASRFGLEALKVFDTDEGLALNLRGLNTRVVEPGTVRAGDTVTKV